MTRRAAVVVASNRASAGVYEDRTGPGVVEWLRERGFDTAAPVVVPDGSPVREALAAAVADGVDVVLTTGGTGISPTDRTPEATAPLLDRPLPGLAEAVRAAGLPAVPTAVLSRGLAGVAGRTLVVNLPGSPGGVRDGLGVLDGVLAHAVDQLRGGDHAGPSPQGGGPDGMIAVPRGPSTASAPGARRPAITGHAHGAGHGHGADPVPGAGLVLRAVVGEEPLDVEEHARLVGTAAAGAVVTFAGVVRDSDGGRDVRALEYSAHPSAGDVMTRVAAEVAAAHPAVQALAVSHRVGPLAIGEAALACAVSSAHRREAFEACAALVDEVKAQLPIWKRQEFADGGEEWVNCP